MSNEIDRNASAQRRTSKLLAAMGIFVALGIVAYIILTLLVNRSVPANPDTHYTCLLYTSPSPRDPKTSRMPSSA